MSKQFKIDTPKSLATQVAQRLREAIIDGQFKLGELIAEESLAASFGVSRTPVREALTQLQALGLVVVRPQRGSYVFEPTPQDVDALAEFRSVMEPRTARLAWQHDRNGTLDDLEAALTEMSAARRHKDAVRYSRADTRFHEAFVAHCGNPYVQAAYAVAGARIAALRTHLSAPADVLAAAGFEQHKRLVELFAEGSFDAFETLMATHVGGTRASHADTLRSRQAQAA